MNSHTSPVMPNNTDYTAYSQVDVTKLDIILPPTYVFFGQNANYYPGSNNNRFFASMPFDRTKVNRTTLQMPINQVVVTPSVNPVDNRWFLR